MNNSEYFSYDALGLAELVRTKQISSIELLEVAIALTEKLNPKLSFYKKDRNIVVIDNIVKGKIGKYGEVLDSFVINKNF